MYSRVSNHGNRGLIAALVLHLTKDRELHLFLRRGRQAIQFPGKGGSVEESQAAWW